MFKAFGPLLVTIKNTYQRGDSIYYQRAIPRALLGRYPHRLIKINLGPVDIPTAARQVAALNKKFEAEWSGLLAAPESSPQALKVHAAALLQSFGVTPGTAEAADSLEAAHFLDALQDKAHAYAIAQGLDDAEYQELTPAEVLPPVELAALKLLHAHALPPTLSEALELHLRIHKKRDDLKFTTYQRRAWAALLAVTGDKAVKDLSRDDVRSYIEKALAGGSKTTTVRRLMGAMRAVLTTWRIEKDPQQANPFENIAIVGEGDDREERNPYSAADLSKLYAECVKKDDSARWLIALCADTGARLAELTGMALADIHIDTPTPYIDIKPHPWRSLKNKASARKVPLVGAALWGAQRVVATAVPGQRFAFPQYTSATGCNASSASATLIGWIQRRGIDHVIHELRHSMADRLRDVGCSKEIRYAIDGHAAQDVGDTYGIGHGLKALAGWLDKVALPTP